MFQNCNKGIEKLDVGTEGGMELILSLLSLFYFENNHLRSPFNTRLYRRYRSELGLFIPVLVQLDTEGIHSGTKQWGVVEVLFVVRGLKGV